MIWYLWIWWNKQRENYCFYNLKKPEYNLKNNLKKLKKLFYDLGYFIIVLYVLLFYYCNYI